jgi:hypothetical protein
VAVIFNWLKNKFAAAPKPEGPSATTRQALFTPQSWEVLVNKLIDMPDPDSVLRKLGMSRVQLGKLLYDDEIYQCCQTREDGLQRVPIRLEPTESQASKFILERCLNGAIRRTILSNAFKALLYGWSIQEIVWDKDVYENEKVYVPRDISGRNLDYFSVLPDGTLVQNVAFDGWSQPIVRDPKLQERLRDYPGAGYSWVVMDTRYKFLLTRSKPSWDNPYGEALLSRLYWPWFFRNTSWQFLGQYLERYAIPILVGVIPETSDTDTEKLAEHLIKAQQDAVVVLKGGSLNAVNPNSTGHELYQNVENMLVRRIQKVVLGQTLTSGTDGGSGNRALGEVHNEVRKDKVESDVGLVQPVVQTYVNACFYLNGFLGNPPEVIFGDEVNLAQARADRDKTLVDAGIVAGFSEDYLMDNYGYRPGEIKMPEVEPMPPRTELIEVEEEDEAEDQNADQREDSPTRPPAKKVAAKFAARRESDAMPSEFLLEALALWGEMRSGNPIKASAIKKAIREANSASEMMSNLENIQESMNPKFAEALLEVNEAGMVRAHKDVRKELKNG